MANPRFSGFSLYPKKPSTASFHSCSSVISSQQKATPAASDSDVEISLSCSDFRKKELGISV